MNAIQPILDKAVAGQRLTGDEALQLLQSHDLAAIGAAADAVTRRLHPEPYRTYNIDRNINYTNICTAVCHFCAFYRSPKSNEGYVLPRAELLAKVRETVELGGNQILLQGGLHPHFKLDWYEEMLSDIKREFPTVNIHGFSPPEIYHFTKLNHLSLEQVLSRLRNAGLGSLPGGGAEILVDRVRRELTRGKVLSDDWLEVMRVWHRLGGNSSATMMFGHVETLPSESSTCSAFVTCKMRHMASPHSSAGPFSPITPTCRTSVRPVRLSTSRLKRSRVCSLTTSPAFKAVGSHKA